MSAPTVKVTRGAGCAYAECSCGWTGATHPTRTGEGVRLAHRDLTDHEQRHAKGTGWFDSRPGGGWVPGPNDPPISK